MRATKETGLKGSLIVSALCTLMLWGWNMQFGSVAEKLGSFILHHGWKATFPDRYSFVLLGFFLGLCVVKRMMRSLKKDAWERSKELLLDAFVLPPA